MKQSQHQRAHSRQDNRRGAHQQHQESSEEITRHLQQLTGEKPQANAKLSQSNQRQKSASRPDHNSSAIAAAANSSTPGPGSKNIKANSSTALNQSQTQKQKPERAQSSNGHRQKLDTQSSLNVPQDVVLPTESCTEGLGELREAIIELYLAIKIRSTDELDKITDKVLEEEKQKLEKVSGLQVLEYVRTSIEIIMNLKIEDLEKEFNNRNLFERDSQGSELGVTQMSVASNNLIQQSMKDAIQAMMETQESARSSAPAQTEFVRGPPRKYEKLIQKLESDVRGHIRLEHEMKIHMDYLENKIELFQAQTQDWEKEKSKLQRQLETAHDKLKLIKDNKDREIKDLSRKLTEMQSKLKTQTARATEAEQKLTLERDCFNQRLSLANSSSNGPGQYKSQENSGGLSAKAIQKNAKYHKAQINSGSKTSSTDHASHGYSSQQHHSAFQTGTYQTMHELSTHSIQKIPSANLDLSNNSTVLAGKGGKSVTVNRQADSNSLPPTKVANNLTNSQIRFQEELNERQNKGHQQAQNPYHADNSRSQIKVNASTRKGSESSDINQYGGRQGRTNFQASNSIQGLHMDQQRALNQSVDHVKATHSLSVNYPSNIASGEIIQAKKQGGKEDLFAGDEVLHEYPEMPIKTKFIKSVDEGTFTKLKQGNNQGNNVTTSTLKERGQSLNTIEHVGNSQLNPFQQSCFPGQNQQHVRSSTITSKPRKKVNSKRNDHIQNQSMESSNASQINNQPIQQQQQQQNGNPHTSIVVRNQINIINNGTNSQQHNGHQKTGSNVKSQMIHSQPMTSGNSRSKVSSRKASQIQPGAGKGGQMYVPQNPMGSSLYSGLEANNLVNFYNSNLLDEMLNKNQGKYLNKSFGQNNAAAAAASAHMRKSTQSALANPSQQQPKLANQNSLLKQQMYSQGGHPNAMSGHTNQKPLHSSSSLEANPIHRQQNSRSMQSRGKEALDAQLANDSSLLIYANQSSGSKQASGVHLRPSSAIRQQQHQQHQQLSQHQQSQQMKVKNSQLAINIKIKGASASQASKHAHNQSVSVVPAHHQAGFPAKVNMGSVENLNAGSSVSHQGHHNHSHTGGQGSKKMQMHSKHQSLNARANNGQNNQVIMNNGSTNNGCAAGGKNQSQSPSTVHRNKKALYRMIKM